MRQMKLGTKIVLGFSLLILIAVLLGGVAFVQMKSVQKESTRLATQYVPEMAAATDIERDARETVLSMRTYALASKIDDYKAGMKSMEELTQEIADIRKLVDSSPELKELAPQVAALEKPENEYQDQPGWLMTTIRNGEKLRRAPRCGPAVPPGSGRLSGLHAGKLSKGGQRRHIGGQRCGEG
jgi:methyl-accepting chemotaxis protein